MLQKIITLLIIFFSAILQSAVFSNLFFWNIGPDILLLLVIFWTTQEGFEKALTKNIAVGMISDFVLFCVVGMHIASFVFVAFFVSFISKRFLVVARNWRVFILAVTIIFSTLANNIFLNGLFLVAKYFDRTEVGSAPVPFFSVILAKGVILNILFFPLVYFALRKIERSSFWQVRKKIF